jgi:O-succinylbenzoic acid--CoA ligase
MSGLVDSPFGGEAPLLVAPDGASLTYRAARGEVERRAAVLARRAAGARPGLVAGADRDGVLGILAALRGGGPPVLVHPRATAAERAAWAARFGLEIVDAGALADGGPHGSAASAAPKPNVDPERIAVVLGTSGSTGRPKGVRLSFRALEAAAAASAANLGWEPGDRWLLSIPAAHVGGLSIVTRCVLAGATVAVPDALRAGFRPAAFTADVDATGATLVSLVPTMLRRLLDDADFAWPTRVRAALIGGAPAPPALLSDAWDRGWPVLATYGLTEAAAQVATQRRGEPPAKTGAVGPPLPGVEVRIRAGRIQLRGDTLFSGYEPASDAFEVDGWFDTGDFGRWDERGRLIVQGRGAELIVSGGENVFPAEVEATLRDMPGVRDAAVVGLDDPEWGEVAAAAVVAGEGVDVSALERWCAARLASFKRPRRWRLVSELPALPSGKPDRRTVRGWFG